ncbi:galactose oxidase-like [Dorcoceras hygrometricum]|uniref:Galactose oxidase-like n=1 Tax=Dorcoceras hygrometricum TaxID=472368 RepID=A0A2Z7BAB2_9LAMI|nr:galactose oxidase-like [Dorcoceras hygrometricum]
MGSNPSTERNYKTAVNSKNKMQMLCMRKETTAQRNLQQKYVAMFYLNDTTHGRRQQLRDLALDNNSLQEWYRKEELLERSPTLPRTYQTTVGNDGNSLEKLTVNSTRVRRTEVDNQDNIPLRIQLAVGPQPLWLRNHNSGLAHRIMVKRLETSSHDPLGITDSVCKNQLVVVSVLYGPFNPYIPIRSMTIGKSRVAIDPIAMHTSWRSNSDIASVTSIGYQRMSASGESSTTMHRLLHASGSHPIPTPYDPNFFASGFCVDWFAKLCSLRLGALLVCDLVHQLVMITVASCWFLLEELPAGFIIANHRLNLSAKAKRCRIHLSKRHRFAIAILKYYRLVLL